jgi:outer membrane protein TolC
VLTLGECVAIAQERQPSLRAVYASANASKAGQTALNNIPPKIGELLSPDLPVRKEQSNRGQLAAAADIQKIHNEIVYDATRLYYTIVYARQQEQVADNVVATLTRLVEIAKIILESPMPGDMTKAKLDMMLLGLGEAKSLRLTAIQGQKQAYAGLREVMGVEPSFVFRVQDAGLPVMVQDVTFTREQAIEMALSRRPELTLAAAGVDAFRLEVYAQAKIPFKKTVPTLASGADIHARQIPQGMRDKDYRPEAIVPEMPPQLVGSKYDRVCRAMAYSQRADAVYDKARNLIILEAENAFYTLELAAEKLVIAKQRNADAKDLMDRVLENVDNLKSQKDQLVLGYVTASRAQSDYVAAVYDYILALAAMERITAGGVRPSFPGR